MCVNNSFKKVAIKENRETGLFLEECAGPREGFATCWFYAGSSWSMFVCRGKWTNTKERGRLQCRKLNWICEWGLEERFGLEI